MPDASVPSEPRLPVTNLTARMGWPACDDDLVIFATRGAPPLPAGRDGLTVRRADAAIWAARWGAGAPVVLLHGGLGHSGNWGHQVPALVAAGHGVVVLDTRGHGRSPDDGGPLSYRVMADDVLAVMDAFGIDRAALVGWSDGACTALVTAHIAPARVAGVVYFGCNMDPSGTKALDASNPVVARCFARHARDYAALSSTPDRFDALVARVTQMQRTQPDYSASDLADIRVPVVIGQAEHDEFITHAHAEYLARCIPGAALRVLPAVSHFAPLQRPALFTELITASVSRVLPG